MPKIEIRSLARILLAAAIQLWPAAINGFPLVYYDTSSYLVGLGSFDAELRWPYRAPFYSWFLTLTGGTITLWLPIVAQAIITIYVLQRVLEAAASKFAKKQRFVIPLVLSAFTALPWYVSQLMPDIFTALLPLILFIIIAHQNLRRGERTAFVAFFGFAVAQHLSNYLIATPLIIFFTFMASRLGSRLKLFPARRFIMRTLGALVVAVYSFFVFNSLVYGRFTMAPMGYIYPMARLLVNGPARWYLNEHCPDDHLYLCNYLNNLPDDSDVFLWSNGSPYFALVNKKGRDGTNEEARTIVWGSLRKYPGTALRGAMADFLEQLVSNRTWLLGNKFLKLYPHIYLMFRTRAPHDYDSWRTSRQMRGTLSPESIEPIQSGISIVAFLFCLFFLFRAETTAQAKLLIGTLLITIVLNAAVCGALSRPFDRYGARVIWLLSFGALAAAPATLEREPSA